MIQDVDGLKMYSVKYYSCVSPSVNLKTSLYRMLFHKAFLILISIPKRIGKNSSKVLPLCLVLLRKDTEKSCTSK